MNTPKKSDVSKADGIASIGSIPLGNISSLGITDRDILDRERIFTEARRQTKPLCAEGNLLVSRLKSVVRAGSASNRVLRLSTCERLITSERKLDSLISGAHPTGGAAEVVAVADYIDLHSGKNPGIVNSPPNVANNVHDIRISPHHASRKDLIFQYRAEGGHIVTKYNGQVKTGSSKYVARSLVKMAKQNGYGKVGYVDATFVNPDGAPRIDAEAFTFQEAREMEEAKVRLRGIRNLEERAKNLVEDIKQHGQNGLSPAAREQLQQLRDEIASAYEVKGVAGRMASGAAVTAASAALLSLLVQYATEGKLDLTTASRAAGKASLYGVGGVLADAGLYHAGVGVGGMTEEAAKVFAQQGVAFGFCAVAVGMDVYSEAKLCRDGQVTVTNAIAASSFKAALDILPFVLAPLGLVGVPILIITQIGGRYLIENVRQAERHLISSVEHNTLLASQIDNRLNRIDVLYDKAMKQCEELEKIYG